jgi:thiamine biosynthesis lipoprotein
MQHTIPQQPTVDERRAAYVEQVMGLPVSIHVRGPAPRDEPVTAAVGRAFALLHRVDALFSTYRSDSEVSRVDRGDLSLADADPWLREVCALADRAREDTDGLFDVRLPGPDGRRRFDPSGIVKGWAAARAAQLLADVPGHDHCLNAGGDVVVGRGAQAGPAAEAPPPRPWRIGIDSPGRPGLLGFVERAEGAVATSGSAARGDHVVDPRSGRPAAGLLSATVTGPSLLQADVLATAAFVRGQDAVRWIERFPGYAALVVREDRTVLRSAGFALQPMR